MSLDKFVGKKLGNYEIVELVGKGGMASVFRAIQPSMNRSVAIKIMSQQFSDNEAFVARFKNEAQLIAQLEHAHILPVYDFGEEEGLLYIVMRYLPAGDLEERIQEGGMPLDEVVPLFRQIGSALDYAHSKGVIHRDLKPGNVMVDAQNNAFLTDFGIAKTLEGTQNLTGTGGVVGTPTYMSPEQGLGDEIDARSDIYSLGVMLFEMLTGEQPFTSDNPMAVMLKHINEAPPNPSKLNPEIPPGVSQVILRAMAKKPEARYETAMDMARALERAAAGEVAEPAATVPISGPVAPDDTMPVTTPLAPEGAATMEAPVAGAPGAATAEQSVVAAPTAPAAPGVAPPVVAPPVAAPPVPAEAIAVTLNKPSLWLGEREIIGEWVQAVGLSIATFLLLLRLTQGGLIEIALLSLVPGVLLYGLLRAPTVGALTSQILILVPLLAHSPALAILWFVLIIVSGSRLNSREIMLSVVTTLVGGSPLGWLVPLLAPWWLRARRTVLPAALGITFAMIFAIVLGWPNAGGLLPTPLGGDIADQAVLTPFDTNYLGLFEPDVWAIWKDFDAVRGSIRGTFDALGELFKATTGLPLLIATAWAVAATLTVSNRRVQSPFLRPVGIGLSLLVLLAAHLLPAREGLATPETTAIVMAVACAVLAGGLSQWPLQVDPNKGNLSGTVMRLLRQTLGAFYMALGVAYFSGLLGDVQLYPILWLVGIFGTLTMITNPMIGPPLVFAALVTGFSSARQVALTIVTALLFIGYIIVNLFFDRRRPRRWNPLGAGLILGAPGLAHLAILPLGVLSLGALEAQVPASILALMGHVLLVATARPALSPLAIIIQAITTLAGALVIERLMGLEVLTQLNHKLRRLLFTVGGALIMAVSYYTLGRVAPGVSVANAVLLSVVTSAALVGAMGERAAYWRRFVEREEEEEEIMEDEEVTGPWAKAT